MKILMTGGSGLLGTAVRKLDQTIAAPSQELMDVTSWRQIQAQLTIHMPDCVLHLAAKTDPPSHDEHPDDGILNNIIGTSNVALACYKAGIRMVYVSSDYVYAGSGPHREDGPLLPPSKFIWSKLGGECAVQMIPQSLVIRCSFGPRPFPHKSVYRDQVNSKLYVDEIAPLILKATKSEVTGVLNIGSDGQTLEAYARRTRKDIATIGRPKWVPADTRLDVTRWKSLF